MDTQSLEKTICYSSEKYDFQGVMRKVLGLPEDYDLRYAHKLVEDSAKWDQIRFQNDTSTDFHKRYYKSPHYQEMVELYQRFVKEAILQYAGDEKEYIVQKEPSFRIHIPNNTALGKRDDDTDDERIGFHCDGDYNHPSTEINFMITVTGQSDTNSCYVESLPGKEDFHPININYGEVFRFYGNRCRHFNKKNKTEFSRISLDFRVIPASKYVEQESSAIHSGRKFAVGGYYMRMERQDNESSTTK